MTFTLKQIRTYLEKQDSFGDCLYNLTEAKILAANEEDNKELESEEEGN